MELKENPSNLTIFSYIFFKFVKTPAPYLMIFGVILWLGAYYLFCEGWKLPLFNKLPGPYEVITEWLNPDPDWGISMYSPEYHDHIYYSCRRILIAFAKWIMWIILGGEWNLISTFIAIADFLTLVSWIGLRFSKPIPGLRLSQTFLDSMESLLMAHWTTLKGQSLHMWEQTDDVREQISQN